jgi:hypothetical protein
VGEYVKKQQHESLWRAPDKDMVFEDLVVRKDVVFRDVTPFFEAANVLEQSARGHVLLVRPRRWGKSVLGAAWLEFLRGSRKELFAGTWAHDKLRSEKLIGVRLDLSRGGLSLGHCVRVMEQAMNLGLSLAEEVPGYGESAKGKRVELRPAFVSANPSDASWSLQDCLSLAENLVAQLEHIATLSCCSVCG